MRKKATDFELEVEDCWHWNRDTARNASGKMGGGRWNEKVDSGGRRVEGKRTNRLCLLKYPTTFFFDVMA